MRHFFSKEKRILRSAEFSRAIRQGRCVADHTLVLYAMASRQPGTTRIGVTIPKKMGNAVTRNRWKRLIREAFRLQSDQIPAGYDYVVRPKKGATADGPQIRNSLVELAKMVAN